jgi:hypothetical protein
VIALCRRLRGQIGIAWMVLMAEAFASTEVRPAICDHNLFDSRVTSSGWQLCTAAMPCTPEQRVLPAFLAAMVLAAGCDAPEGESADVLADVLVSELNDGDLLALRDVLPLLAPAGLPDDLALEDLGPEALDIPVVVSSTGGVEGSVIPHADAFTTAIDPMATGELACATASIADPADGAQVAMSATPLCGFAFDGSISPDTTYDPVGCPHQYITEVTGTEGRALSAYWGWYPVTLDQTICDASQRSISMYAAALIFSTRTRTVTESWTKIGTATVHGQWMSGSSPYCDWVLDNNAPLLALGSGHFYWKVRTASVATSFGFKQVVEGGVAHGPGPC